MLSEERSREVANIIMTHDNYDIYFDLTFTVLLESNE